MASRQLGVGTVVRDTKRSPSSDPSGLQCSMTAGAQRSGWSRSFHPSTAYKHCPNSLTIFAPGPCRDAGPRYSGPKPGAPRGQPAVSPVGHYARDMDLYREHDRHAPANRLLREAKLCCRVHASQLVDDSARLSPGDRLVRLGAPGVSPKGDRVTARTGFTSLAYSANRQANR